MIDEQLSEDERFMRQALTEARKAFEQGEVPVGAVVVWNGRIVGRGHNLVETLSDATAHAEMQAITAAASSVGGKYLAECKLYVTVEPEAGSPAERQGADQGKSTGFCSATAEPLAGRADPTKAICAAYRRKIRKLFSIIVRGDVY